MTSYGTLNVSPEQQRLLDRISIQRERLRARYEAARFSSEAEAAVGGNPSDAPWILRAVSFARQHPAATAALAGAAMALGPRRLIRWVGALLPLISRMRR